MNTTTLSPALVAAYRWHKQSTIRRAYGDTRPVTALAIERARADVAAGKARYPNSPRFSAAGSPFQGGLRWCESPADLGLRFVGYCDKLVGRGIDHTGWFCDDFQDSTARGVVYQLPARNGRPIYLAAIQDPNNGSADRNGPAIVDFSTTWEGDEGGNTADSDHYGAHRDAAYAADQLAERYAEKERHRGMGEQHC